MGSDASSTIKEYRSERERFHSDPLAFLCERYFGRTSDGRRTLTHNQTEECCQAFFSPQTESKCECEDDCHLPSHIVLYRAMMEHADVQRFFQMHYEKVKGRQTSKQE